jgi:type II restriction enzyme
MQLICDLSIAEAYRSAAQRARVISEFWFSQNCYCLACPSDRLQRSAPNTRAMDFSCEACGHRYELKTFRKRPTKSLVDGAYSALLAQINSDSAPTLCLLERTDSWQIKSMMAIHSSFLTPIVVEQRPPLGLHARRAGWIGCNIRLDRIPIDGEIAVIRTGVCIPRAEVRARFRRFLPLSKIPAKQRGWTTLTLSAIRELAKGDFRLSDLYEREPSFAQIYPGNRHIRAKIRQQLQVLRDLGVLCFDGPGRYRLLDNRGSGGPS